MNLVKLVLERGENLLSINNDKPSGIDDLDEKLLSINNDKPSGIDDLDGRL